MLSVAYETTWIVTRDVFIDTVIPWPVWAIVPVPELLKQT